jgi:hypothetical protein
MSGDMTQGEKIRMKKNVEKITALSNFFIDFPSSLFTPSPSPLPEKKGDRVRGY